MCSVCSVNFESTEIWKAREGTSKGWRMLKGRYKIFAKPYFSQLKSSGFGDTWRSHWKPSRRRVCRWVPCETWPFSLWLDPGWGSLWMAARKIRDDSSIFECFRTFTFSRFWMFLYSLPVLFMCKGKQKKPTLYLYFFIHAPSFSLFSVQQPRNAEKSFRYCWLCKSFFPDKWGCWSFQLHNN